MTDDLSHHHAPLTQLFTADPGKDYQLNAAQIRQFEEQGFLAGIQVLDAHQLEVLRGELSMFMDAQYCPQHWYEFHHNEASEPNTVLFHALGAWRNATGFHDLLWHPAITSAASQLLQGPARFWHDQLFCKPPHDGGVVAWHQDYSYWTRTQPMAHLTCWIGLDDSCLANGCVHYIPGSHRWPLLPITGLAGDMDAIADTLTSEQWEQFQQATPVELAAGEAIFHHPLTVHGSFANRSPRPRRATVLNFVREDVCSDSHEPLLAGVPAIPPGEPLSGRFFPRLI